ncbi:MAG: sulfur carrier protein ThiS [Marinilabiliaceae bacterium]|nr:sulfur carrier protein ThiS [Marinilabiliaceae bacterium]
MNIIVNDEQITFDGQTISDLTKQLNLPEAGVAIAIDSVIISREQWASYQLNEGSNLLIIKAACGG